MDGGQIPKQMKDLANIDFCIAWQCCGQHPGVDDFNLAKCLASQSLGHHNLTGEPRLFGAASDQIFRPDATRPLRRVSR